MKDTKNTNTTTYIHQDTTVTADISCTGNLHIAGNVEGNITINGLLILNDTGSINGEFFASEAKLSGSVTGNLRIDGTITLHTGAKVTGNIFARNLITEAGAQINGLIKTGKSVNLKEVVETEFTVMQKKVG